MKPNGGVRGRRPKGIFPCRCIHPFTPKPEPASPGFRSHASRSQRKIIGDQLPGQKGRTVNEHAKKLRLKWNPSRFREGVTEGEAGNFRGFLAQPAGLTRQHESCFNESGPLLRELSRHQQA